MNQVKDMGEHKSSVNNNFLEISKQMVELSSKISEMSTRGIPERPPDTNMQITDSTEIRKPPQNYYQSVVNLDNPVMLLLLWMILLTL